MVSAADLEPDQSRRRNEPGTGVSPAHWDWHQFRRAGLPAVLLWLWPILPAVLLWPDGSRRRTGAARGGDAAGSGGGGGAADKCGRARRGAGERGRDPGGADG